MAEKTTVAFRIAQSVRDDWDEAVEDSPEYQSLSHLIRLSVQRELADTDREVVSSPDNNEDTSNSEILKSLTRVERAVDSIQDEMKAAGREQRAAETFNLQRVLLELLTTDERPVSDVLPAHEGEEATFKQASDTADELAARIGANTSDVANALEQLTENTGVVQGHTLDDTTYYWRRA